MPQTMSVEQVRDAVRREVEALRTEYLENTAAIMRFETVSGGDAEAQKRYHEEIPRCLAFLRGLAEKMGFTWRNFHDRSAEIAWESGDPGRPVVGIAAHIDVVPVAPTGWTHPPFSGTYADGQLWSRGSQDDKGPLMSALYGMYAVKRAGMTLPVDVRIIIGTCEETGDWDDIAEYLKLRGAPDFAFTPDAEFPVTVGEKGMSNIKISAKWDSVAADEQTGIRFLSLAGGSRPNIVIDKCEARFSFAAADKSPVTRELMRQATEFTVQNPKSNITILPEVETGADSGTLTVSFLGKAAHGSTPHKGHNAAVDALVFFSDVEALPAEVRALVRFLAFAGRETDGSNLMLASEHHFVGKTTVNLGVVEIGEKGGFGTLNIRPTLGLTVAETMEKVRNAAAAFSKATGGTFEVTQDGRALDAIYVDPKSPKAAPYLDAMVRAFTSVTGREGALEAIGGTTYSKAFPVCVAFGPGLAPDDLELAHQTNERVPIDTLMRNATIYGTSLALMR